MFEKMTKGGKVQVSTIPLLDYKGRSLRPAVEALQAQKGEPYLLRDTCAVRAGIRSKERSPARSITSQHGQQLLRAVIADMDKCLPDELAYMRGAYKKASLHSFKGWLDTLAHQANMEDRDISFLCHWDKGKMQKRYIRNYAAEVDLEDLVQHRQLTHHIARRPAVSTHLLQ